jgi:GNAT superfamily N-acetyltransferase
MAPLSKETSLEYTESSKREELFDETGRFLLLRRGSGTDAQAGVDMPGALPGKEREATADGEVLGYVSFRFDTEETLGSRDAEVAYWYVTFSPSLLPSFTRIKLSIRRADDSYELQLDPSIRRLGLAKVLMDELERIGKSRKLDKVMLTCLKGFTFSAFDRRKLRVGNTAALSFYRKQGYVPPFGGNFGLSCRGLMIVTKPMRLIPPGWKRIQIPIKRIMRLMQKVRVN